MFPIKRKRTAAASFRHFARPDFLDSTGLMGQRYGNEGLAK
jgi:hypothetical protein